MVFLASTLFLLALFGSVLAVSFSISSHFPRIIEVIEQRNMVVAKRRVIHCGPIRQTCVPAARHNIIPLFSVRTDRHDTAAHSALPLAA